MSAGMAVRPVVKQFEEMLAATEATQQEILVLRGKNEALEATLAQQKEDMKEFEQFRHIIENPKIDFYNIKLTGSAILNDLLARGTKLYGKRFNLDKKSGQDRNYARQCMSGMVMACVRYCLSNNSRWNEVVARYLSRPKNAG